MSTSTRSKKSQTQLPEAVPDPLKVDLPLPTAVPKAFTLNALPVDTFVRVFYPEKWKPHCVVQANNGKSSGDYGLWLKPRTYHDVPVFIGRLPPGLEFVQDVHGFWWVTNAVGHSKLDRLVEAREEAAADVRNFFTSDNVVGEEAVE